MSGPDTETRRAIAAVTRMLQLLTEQGHYDPAVAANEIVQALRAHGWRPTPAQAPPPWQATQRPADPAAVHAIAAQARAAITREEP